MTFSQYFFSILCATLTVSGLFKDSISFFGNTSDVMQFVLLHIAWSMKNYYYQFSFVHKKNVHASNISKPTTVSKHFLTNDHSANDITLIPLELIKSSRDSMRKAREAYLIERGRTLEPLGINKER